MRQNGLTFPEFLTGLASGFVIIADVLRWRTLAAAGPVESRAEACPARPAVTRQVVRPALPQRSGAETGDSKAERHQKAIDWIAKEGNDKTSRFPRKSRPVAWRRWACAAGSCRTARRLTARRHRRHLNSGLIQPARRSSPVCIPRIIVTGGEATSRMNGKRDFRRCREDSGVLRRLSVRGHGGTLARTTAARLATAVAWLSGG